MALAIVELVKGERYDQYLFKGLATRKGEGVDCYHLLSQVLEISVSVRSVQVFSCGQTLLKVFLAKFKLFSCFLWVFY